MLTAPPYRSLHSQRQRILWGRLAASFLTLVIAAIALFPLRGVGASTAEILLLLAAALCQLGILMSRLRLHHIGLKEFAERSKTFWTEAFQPDTTAAAPAPGAEAVPEPYFDSQESPGWARLIQITAESGRWTERLAKKWRLLLFASLVVPLALLTLSLLLPMGLEIHTQSEIARLAIICLTFLVAGDVSELLTECHHVVEELEEVLPALAHLANSKAWNAGEILLQISRYHNVVSSSSPIPTFIYRWSRDELTSEWEQERKYFSRT